MANTIELSAALHEEGLHIKPTALDALLESLFEGQDDEMTVLARRIDIDGPVMFTCCTYSYPGYNG